MDIIRKLGNNRAEASALSNATLPAATTVVGLIKRNVEVCGNAVWIRKKVSGIWREYTWAEALDTIKSFSMGLRSLGFQQGDVLAIAGDADPEWVFGEIAAQAAGGSVVGLDTSCPLADLKSILLENKIRFVLCQDQEQVDKMLEVDNEVRHLVKIVYWRDKGLKRYDQQVLSSFDQVVRLGTEYDAKNPGAFDDFCRSLSGTQDAIAWYRCENGTMVMTKLTHADLLNAVEHVCGAGGMRPEDEWFCISSPADGMEQLLGVIGSLHFGMTINFPENGGTVQEDMREIGPTLVFLPSELCEKLVADIRIRIAVTTRLKRVFWNLGYPLGRRHAELRAGSDSLPLLQRLISRVARFLLFRPLQARLGLGNVKCMYTSVGIGPDECRLLQDIGLNVKLLEGLPVGSRSFALGH